MDRSRGDAFAALFLAVDGSIKFCHMPPAIAGMTRLGWSPSLVPPQGESS